MYIDPGGNLRTELAYVDHRSAESNMEARIVLEEGATGRASVLERLPVANVSDLWYLLLEVAVGRRLRVIHNLVTVCGTCWRQQQYCLFLPAIRAR